MINNVIKELREQRGLSQLSLATAIGYSQGNIGKWEQNIHEPTAGAILALSNFFEVSADYLLGLEDEAGARASAAPNDQKKALAPEIETLLFEAKTLKPKQALKVLGYIEGIKSQEEQDDFNRQNIQNFRNNIS